MYIYIYREIYRYVCVYIYIYIYIYIALWSVEPKVVGIRALIMNYISITIIDTYIDNCYVQLLTIL